MSNDYRNSFAAQFGHLILRERERERERRGGETKKKAKKRGGGNWENGNAHEHQSAGDFLQMKQPKIRKKRRTRRKAKERK